MSVGFLIIGAVLSVYDRLYPPQLSNPLLVGRIITPLKTAMSSFVYSKDGRWVMVTNQSADFEIFLGGPNVMPSTLISGRGKQTAEKQREQGLGCLLLVLKTEE